MCFENTDWLADENQSFTPGEGHSCDVTSREMMGYSGPCKVHLGSFGVGRF